MYHPTSRVLAVLEFLQSRPGLVSGADLADRLETDVRTIRRYILKLQDVGIPIESVPGRAGGYRLRPGHRLPPLLFSAEEGMATFLALMGSPWLEVGQDRAAVEGALSKVARVLPQESRERIQALASHVTVASRSGRRHLPEARILFDLGEAVQKSLCVEVVYRPEDRKASTRVVEPCGLVGGGGHWYLVAWCRLRSDYRLFRLDRAESFRVLEESFPAHRNFDYRAYAQLNLEDYERRYPLVVWFQATVDQVTRALSPGAGVATAEAGGCLWTSRVTDLPWAAQELLLTGFEFRVQQPPELGPVLLEAAERARRSVSSLLPPSP